MSIPREGSRDTGSGIIISVTPDVCRTPVGSSMPPIPYCIYAIQGDDANTAATVRMTGQRAHNMASIVTQCSGDAPGTGGGVSSGTTGSVCHPRSHSNTVRIQGEWAVRHNDYWDMNNRNTFGRLTWVESVETFEPTPTITRNNTPGSELPPGSFQVADASGGWSWFAPPEPETLPEIEIPGAGSPPAETAPTQPGPVGPNDNRDRRPPATPNPILMQLRLIGELFSSLGRQADIYEEMERTITVPDGEGGFRHVTPEQLERELMRELGVETDEELAELIERLEAEERTEAETTVDAESGRTEDTVTIHGDEEQRDEPECRIGPHSEMLPACRALGMQAHHVVPDRSFRVAGPRGARMVGGPSYGEGLAVCVESNRVGRDAEHSVIHNVYFDPQADFEARTGSHPPFITLARAEDLGAQALEIGTDGRCRREFIRNELRRYHSSSQFTLEPDTLVRGTRRRIGLLNIRQFGGRPGGADER
ncbi:DUF4150 domain-containing protein [Tateyamaria omphalii]|uniref:Uncharacterized protein n=1 Tax=Tateyamaria omphalii TaxID=299262 RepID=A0A1P8MU71_9RHOB|nr:DUF4150 domain-containing protein [Tateyamaria omphalii]APX11588.1 hypothetical protein BWR18_07750 [Tateyamaria omphalii]